MISPTVMCSVTGRICLDVGIVGASVCIVGVAKLLLFGYLPCVKDDGCEWLSVIQDREKS